MIRDYSEQKMNDLKKQIQEITDKNWCGFTDWLGDMGLSAGKLLSIVDINDDMSNIKKYHEYVLDQNNTTVNELENIFAQVREVDILYRTKLIKLYSIFNDYNTFIKKATEQINPQSCSFDVGAISKNMYDMEKKILNNGTIVANMYDESLEKGEKRTAKEGFKGVAQGTLSIIGNVFTLPAKMIKDPTAIVTETWGMINDVLDVASDAASLGILGVGYGMSKIMSDDDIRYEAIKEASGYQNRDGLKGQVEAEFEGEAGFVAGKIIGGADLIIDIYDVSADIYNISTGVKSLSGADEMKTIFSNKSTTAERGAATIEFIAGRLGFDSLSMEDTEKLTDFQKWINKSDDIGTVIGWGGKIVDYGVAIDEGTLGKEITKNFAVQGYVNKIGGVGSDFMELGEPYRDISYVVGPYCDGNIEKKFESISEENDFNIQPKYDE